MGLSLHFLAQSTEKWVGRWQEWLLPLPALVAAVRHVLGVLHVTMNGKDIQRVQIFTRYLAGVVYTVPVLKIVDSVN